MKKSNKIIALALSASFILVAPQVSNAATESLEVIGIDNNEKPFDFKNVPNNKVELVINDFDTDENIEKILIDKDTNSKKIEREIPDSNEYYIEFVNKEGYSSEKFATETSSQGNHKVIELFNPSLDVEGLEEGSELNAKVIWEKNNIENELVLKNGEDQELTYNDDRRNSNDLPSRNSTPKIEINGSELKSGKVLVNDSKTGELVFNLDENGNPNYALITDKNGKLKFVDNYELDANNGTSINFSNANETGAEERTPEDLNDLYNEKDDNTVRIIEHVVPYETVERENPDLPKGERKRVQKGENGKSEIYIYPDDSDDNAHREIRIVKEPVDEIFEVGTEETITTEVEIDKREIPFTVTEIKRNDLPEGYREVVRPGFNGYHIVRVTRTFVNGVEDKSKRTSEIVVTRPAEEEIVLVGTKKEESTPLEPSEDATTVDYKFEYTEFEEERIANPELAVGEERIIQVGSAGYTLYKVVLDGNGKEISREKVAERMAQNHIVEYGTKEVKDEKTKFPLVPLIPADKIEDEKCKFPLVDLFPSTPTPQLPGIKPVPTPTPIPTEDIVVNPTPIPESIPQPEIDFDKLIKDITDGTEEIKEVLAENEANQVDNTPNLENENINDKTKKPVDKNTNEKSKEAVDEGTKVIEKTKVRNENVIVKVPEVKEKTAKSQKATKSSNPKTGISGLAEVVTTLSAATAGIFASKKRK